jgi:hypothetical protein
MWDYTGEIDSTWLVKRIDVTEFFRTHPLRTAKSRDSEVQQSIEKELLEDQSVIESSLQQGDEVWLWIRRFFPDSPSGGAGIAILRRGTVVKAWGTSVIL